MGKFQFAGTACRDRRTKHAPALTQHEIHLFRGDGLGGRDEVSLILTVLVIHDDDELSLTEIVNRLFYRSKYFFIHLCKVSEKFGLYRPIYQVFFIFLNTDYEISYASHTE